MYRNYYHIGLVKDKRANKYVVVDSRDNPAFYGYWINHYTEDNKYKVMGQLITVSIEDIVEVRGLLNRLSILESEKEILNTLHKLWFLYDYSFHDTPRQERIDALNRYYKEEA